MGVVLAVDEGTSSARALLIGDQGDQISLAQKSFSSRFPRPQWVEHDPVEIWKVQRAIIEEAIIKSGVQSSQIQGIGITNQRETTVVWDRKTGEPVCNAIVWQDKRTAGFCQKLREDGFSELIRGKTGLVVDAYFSASKVNWILENVPGARERAEKGELAFGTIDSWLVWNMTNGEVHVTDTSNASRTMLFNIHTMDWDDELLGVFNIPRSMLPRVVQSSEVVGEYLGIPIAGIAGDQQAALFGQRCGPGMVKNTYGTGCFMLSNTGETPVNSENNLLSTVAWTKDGHTQYAHEGSVFMGGAVVQWFRDEFSFIKKSKEIEELAAGIPNNGGTYLVPAFEGLGAPHWDSNARPVFSGFPRSDIPAHFARAVEESIAYQVFDLARAMSADMKEPLSEFRVDGGATRDNFLMQFQADILGFPVVRSAISESTAYGAAFLAGLATGVWSDDSAINAQWRADRTFEPTMSEDERERNLAGWKKAVERARV